MRLTTGSLAVAAALVFATVALWPDTQDGPAPALAQEKAEVPADEAAPQPIKLGVSIDNEATARRLRKRIEAEFDETPLQDVLETLADQVRFQVLFDEKALEFAGISTKTPVTIRLHSVPADFLLELILRQLGLGYTIREGIVIVTTPDELENALEVEVYDIRDLLSAVSETKATLPQPPRATPYPPKAIPPQPSPYPPPKAAASHPPKVAPTEVNDL